MKPLALLFYENLLTGNQLVNKLQELGYRTMLVSDPHHALGQAARERPLVVIVELALQTEAVCDAIQTLKRNAPTAHIPVLGYGKFGGSKADRRKMESVRAAGADLVAAEAGLLSQFPRLLDQVLQVD